MVQTVKHKYHYRTGYFPVINVAPICFGLVFVKACSGCISDSHEEEIHLKLFTGIPHVAVLIGSWKTEQ